MTETNTNKILCIYAGYSPPQQDASWAGSEIMLENLAERLTPHYEVHIFGHNHPREEKNKVKYHNAEELYAFLQENEIEILIISRYIHYFVEYPHTSKKTFIWAHDRYFNNYWNFQNLHDEGRNVIQYKDKQINKYIALTNWHKDFLQQTYKISPEKIKVIGNAIDSKNWDEDEEKVKNRFIWASSPDRGLKTAINCFENITKKYPDAELHVYWNSDDIEEDLMNKINTQKNIKFLGKQSNKKVIKEFQKAEYWFYPTRTPETYCINALEAQRSECICVSTSIGGLKETISDRGILIDFQENMSEEEFEKKATEEMLNIMQDEERKEKLKRKSIEWAKKQNWNEKIKVWLDLLERE